MAAFLLPCASDQPHFTFQCDLDDVTFGFEFLWNERESAWFVNLSDIDGNPLVSGARVVVGFPLLGRTRNDATPAGALIVLDTSGEDRDPDFDDLGRRVQILYYSVVDDGA